MIELRKCVICGKEQWATSRRKTCSDKCRKANNRKTKKKEVSDEY